MLINVFIVYLFSKLYTKYETLDKKMAKIDAIFRK